jgi:cob(I)alamin adenosyltransferase
MEDKAKEYTEKQYYKVDNVDEFNGEPLAVYRAYKQCQEDMADDMVKLANYLRNNYQPLAPNQAEWQRIKDKKVLRIEDIINSLNKQD